MSSAETNGSGSMSEMQNGFTVKASRGKRSTITMPSSRTFLGKKTPQVPFSKFPYQEVSHSTTASVIQEEECEEENRALVNNGGAQKIVVENTYKIAPDSDKRFSSGKSNACFLDCFG